MNPDLLSLLITEVFPNPETGNEWVELYCPDENQDVGNFTNFTLSDEKKIIYTFDIKGYYQFCAIVNQ